MNLSDKVINIALNEVGYLEKSKSSYQKNPSILYSKTDGAGSDNYTKYGKEMHDIYPSIMDFPAYWCDAFVDWCFYKAYGIATAKSLLNGDFNDYTVASCSMYEKHDALYKYPKIGDQVFFTRNGKPNGCYHTGIVYDVDTKYFYTVEGNTSKASNIVSNGGGVAKKKYSIQNQSGKTLFGRPNYNLVSDAYVEKKSAQEIALEIVQGKGGWGNGVERKIKLIDAGYNPSVVQGIINSLMKEQKTVDNERLIWDYLMQKLENPYAVAGFMGNMKAESNLNPKNLQNSFEKRHGFTDDSYTTAVDNGAYKNFSTDLAGYGLCQWTSSGRKSALLNFKGNRSIGNIEMQLDFLWLELTTSYKSVLNAIRNAKSTKEASDIVLTKFERPKDQSDAMKDYRAKLGIEIYHKFIS